MTGLLLLAAFAAVLLVTGAAEARARGDRAQRRHPRHTHRLRRDRAPGHASFTASLRLATPRKDQP